MTEKFREFPESMTESARDGLIKDYQEDYGDSGHLGEALECYAVEHANKKLAAARELLNLISVKTNALDTNGEKFGMYKLMPDLVRPVIEELENKLETYEREKQQVSEEQQPSVEIERERKVA